MFQYGMLNMYIKVDG